LNEHAVWFWIVAWLIVGIAFFGFLTNAYGDYFRTIGVYHADNPLVCIMNPDPEKENVKMIWEQTNSAINEWQNKLINATNGNWEMNVQEYEWSEHAFLTVDDYPDCTIFVNYNHITEDESVGRTGWDFSNSNRYYYWVEVDTHTVEKKVHIELDGKGGNVSTNSVIRELPDTDLRNVILHEFGHSLGVEHYYVTTDCRIEECDYNPIMYSQVNLFVDDVKYVTEKDLNMVIRIYGEDGFDPYKPLVIPRHCEILDTEFCPIVR